MKSNLSFASASTVFNARKCKQQRSLLMQTLLIGGLLGTLALPNAPLAAVRFEAHDTSDEGDADLADNDCKTSRGTCTLRAAIEQISADSFQSSCGVFDRIILDPGTYPLHWTNAALTIGRDDGRDVCVRVEGTADNQGPNASVIDGGALLGQEGHGGGRERGVFHVGTGAWLILDGITITKGHRHHPGGGAVTVTSSGSLSIFNSFFTKNSTHDQGGAILNKGFVEISESTFYDNWSALNLEQLSGRAGGAIANVGGVAFLDNVTISGNRAVKRADYSRGGGILNMKDGWFLGYVGINNTTIAFNTSAGQGGGIFNEDGSIVRLENSIVAQNNSDYGYPDCYGTLTSEGYNLV